MDTNSEPQIAAEDNEDDVYIDDNVDEIFEQKMKKLRELGLYDDRMLDKVNLIKNMDNGSVPVPRNHIKRGYQVLGRPMPSQDELQDFKGEWDDGSGAQKFKPIKESGLKWSLPCRKRQHHNSDAPQSSNHSNRSDDNNRDRDQDRDRDRSARDKDRERDRHRDRERDVKPESELSGDGFKADNRFKTEFSNDLSNHSNEAIDRKYDNDNNTDAYKASTSEESNKRVRFNTIDKKPTNFNKFFDNRRSKPVEKKTETITDIEAFIRDCNKKAEKPKPILDDIDDFIAKANQRFNEISANLEKTYNI